MKLKKYFMAILISGAAMSILGMAADPEVSAGIRVIGGAMTFAGFALCIADSV